MSSSPIGIGVKLTDISGAEWTSSITILIRSSIKGMEENNKEFLSTYGKKVSFCDEAWLDDVIEYLNIYEKGAVPE